MASVCSCADGCALAGDRLAAHHSPGCALPEPGSVSSTAAEHVIVVIYGTTGELIKLMPVLKALDEGGHSFLQASTGQQTEQIPPLLELAGLPPVDVWLARGSGGHDLRSNRDVPGWAATVATRFLRRRGYLRGRLRVGKGRPLVLVHGDTMTSLYGAVLGRLLGVPVAHIESGLRSFDLRHPFPEELNRRLTSRLATILYAPGAVAAGNLSRGTVVDTGSNTIRDALDLVAPDVHVPLTLPEAGFGIASLHRFELINDRRLFAETIAVLRESQREMLWVDHPVTIAALDKHGLSDEVSGNLRRIPRLDFFGFVAVLRRCSFLVTDSGGSQEESYYLDIPCLVHRKRTERQDGLGENVLLSRFASEPLREFLLEPSAYRRRHALPASHPSEIIVADLQDRGFADGTPPA